MDLQRSVKPLEFYANLCMLLHTYILPRREPKGSIRLSHDYVVHRRRVQHIHTFLNSLVIFLNFLGKLKKKSENYQAALKLTHDFEVLHLRATYNDTVPCFATFAQMKIPNPWSYNIKGHVV